MKKYIVLILQLDNSKWDLNEVSCSYIVNHFCDKLHVPCFTTKEVNKLMASPTIDHFFANHTSDY